MRKKLEAVGAAAIKCAYLSSPILSHDTLQRSNSLRSIFLSRLNGGISNPLHLTVRKRHPLSSLTHFPSPSISWPQEPQMLNASFLLKKSCLWFHSHPNPACLRRVDRPFLITPSLKMCPLFVYPP